jgi:tRNA G18 (ribose-2'-O)-methylase SpoU
VSRPADPSGHITAGAGVEAGRPADIAMSLADDDPHPWPDAGPGVGPWEGPWPEDPRYDATLLAEGDRRNVVDCYRYWTVEAITADLDATRGGLHVAVENWEHDFNIGSIVRTANAFGVAAVHIVGRRRWNRRGAMVTDRYQHICHHPAAGDVVAWARETGIVLIGIDNVGRSRPLEGARLPERCLMWFGSERAGLSDEALDACQDVLAITQYGSTRSINAGAAAAIAMWAWAIQHR